MPKSSKTTNQRLSQALLQHAHYIVAVEAGLAAMISGRISAALDKASRLIIGMQIDPELAVTYETARLLASLLIPEIQRATYEIYGELRSELTDLALAEDKAVLGILNDLLPAPVAIALDNAPLTQAAANVIVNEPSAGTSMPSRVNGLIEEAAANVQAALANAVASNTKLSELNALLSSYLAGGVARSLNVLSATEAQRVATAAQQVVFASNRNLLYGVQYSATLDARTCSVCEELDGTFYSYTSGNTPPNVPQHPHCFIQALVPVRTPGGAVPISKIVVGDLVLTHKGRFRPVTELHRNNVPAGTTVVSFTLDMKSKPGAVQHTGTVTSEHPLLVSRGGIKQWLAAKDVTTADKLLIEASVCPECNKLSPPGLLYCCKSCMSKHIAKRQWADPAHRPLVAKKNKIAMLKQYATGARDGHAGVKAAHAAVREKIKNGTFTLTRPEVQARAREALGQQHKQSGLERHLIWALKKLGVDQYTIGYRIKRDNGYYFYPDIVFEKQRILVEADGNAWHFKDASQREHDIARDAELRALGWSVYHIHENFIKNDPIGAASTIRDLLKNHAGEILFTEVAITSINSYALKKSTRTYNLSVEEDESYVVKSIVFHNCRCRLLPIVKSWQDLGFKQTDIESLTSLSSLHGESLPTEDYATWLASQRPAVQANILGPKKYAAYAAGAIKPPSSARSAIPASSKPIRARDIAYLRGM